MSSDLEDKYLVWDTLSMAWSEVDIGNEEYPEIATNLKKRFNQWKEVDDIIWKDIYLSFAPMSLLVLFVVIPIIGLLFITPFPDWGYDEAYLKERITEWESKSRWFHLLNPLRIIGYPMAIMFGFGVRRKLKKAYLEL